MAGNLPPHACDDTLIALIILGGYLATENIAYLWIMSLGVMGQYITDRLDGEVGRAHNTGLIKWDSI